jgi:hypothetical protein
VATVHEVEVETRINPETFVLEALVDGEWVNLEKLVDDFRLRDSS